MNDAVERLGGLERDDRVRIALADGETIAGRVSPIAYVPGEHLRLELRSEESESVRYELVSTCEDGEWTPVEVRRIESGEGAKWTPLAEIESLSVEYREGHTDYQEYFGGTHA